MDSKTQIIEQYFKLSDLASNDEQALHEIIQLFSKRAVVKGANGFVADNPTRVAEFFKNFFKDNQELRHLFHVVVNDGNYQAEWAVAGFTSSVVEKPLPIMMSGSSLLAKARERKSALLSERKTVTSRLMFITSVMYLYIQDSLKSPYSAVCST